MSRKTLKLTLAAGLVTFGLGGFGLGLAWATPPQGFTSTAIVGPVAFGEFDTTADADDWKVRLKAKGLSDVYVTHLKIVPGGHGGWHSHPGPSIISVKAGTATFYDDCDDFVRHQFPAGTGFVGEPSALEHRAQLRELAQLGRGCSSCFGERMGHEHLLHSHLLVDNHIRILLLGVNSLICFLFVRGFLDRRVYLGHVQD